jgi:hypothetical protein
MKDNRVTNVFLGNPYNGLTKKAQRATKDISRAMLEDRVGDAGPVHKK